MSSLAIPILFAVATSTAAPSSSAPHQHYPNILESEMGPIGSPRAFANLAAYADCAVKHEKKAALAFLAMDYPSPKWRERGQQLASETSFCLRSSPLLSMEPAYMRGALIEAMFHQEAKDGKFGAPAKFGSAHVEPLLPPALAECIAQRRPGPAAELLSTKIASDAQRQAYSRLEPDLSSCAAQVGVKRYSPGFLRYQIAEYLYRQRHPSIAGAAR